MKIAALLGLNLLVVGAGILAYDVVRGDDTAESAAVSAQFDDLNDRLDGLESRFDLLDRGGSERKLSNRMLQFEDRIGALEARRSMTTANVAEASDEADGTAAAVASALAAGHPIAGDQSLAQTEIDVERVKAALKEVERQRDVERATRMADGLAERLGLSLTEDQRKRLGTELSDFRETARDTMRSTRESGGGREEMMAAFDELRSGLTTQLEEFLPASDAKSITDEIANGPRAMMGGGGPGGPGSGGGFVR